MGGISRDTYRMVLLICTIAPTLFALPTSSLAALFEFDASLSGPAESPSNTSPGTGFARVLFNDATNMMEVNVSFSGLVGTTTASHIHCCVAAPGTAIVATTVPTFTDFPLGVMSGTYDHTFDMTLSSSYNPAFISAHGGTIAGAEAALLSGLLADQAYLNIHTNVAPTGEIRGFLAAVPEPSTWLMMLLGFVSLGFAAYRNRYPLKTISDPNQGL
jgi:CHRD domain-containing protein/PEP-CTERM motif-containing protein